MNGRTKLWAAGSIVLIVAIGVGLWKFGGGPQTGGEQGVAAAKESKRLTAMKTQLGSALPARKVTIEAAERPKREFDPYDEWDTAKILDHFAVPSARFDGETILEAVEVLREIYAEYGGKNVRFRVEGGGDFGYPVVAEIDKNLSMRELLDLVGGLAGFDVEPDDGLVTFRRKPPAPDDDEIMTVRLAARPELLLSEEERDDPFAPDEPQPALSPSEWFAGFGIESPAAQVDAESGEWVLTNRKAELMRALALYDVLTETRRETLRGRQIHLQFKNVGEEGGSAMEPKTFSGKAEFEAAMRELAGKGNVEVMSAPSVVARAGQRAKIEIIREVIYPGGYDAAGTPENFEIRNVGFSLEIDPKLAGLDQVILKGRVDYTTLGELALREAIRPGGNWNGKTPAEFLKTKVWTGEDFQSRITEFEGALYDGNTAVFPAAEDEATEILQFISAKRITEDGQPLFPE